MRELLHGRGAGYSRGAAGGQEAYKEICMSLCLKFFRIIARAELWGQACRRVSLSNEITWQFTLEFGEIARDHGDVEMGKNGFPSLAVEQKPEGRLHIIFRGMRISPSRANVAVDSVTR